MILPLLMYGKAESMATGIQYITEIALLVYWNILLKKMYLLCIGEIHVGHILHTIGLGYNCYMSSM